MSITLLSLLYKQRKTNEMAKQAAIQKFEKLNKEYKAIDAQMNQAANAKNFSRCDDLSQKLEEIQAQMSECSDAIENAIQ